MMGATEQRLYQLVMTREEAELLEVLIVFADTMFRVVARDVEYFARIRKRGPAIKGLFDVIVDMCIKADAPLEDTTLRKKIHALLEVLMRERNEEEGDLLSRWLMKVLMQANHNSRAEGDLEEA